MPNTETDDFSDVVVEIEGLADAVKARLKSDSGFLADIVALIMPAVQAASAQTAPAMTIESRPGKK